MKILLVEDDPIASELLATTLTNHHYAIDTVTNGQDALELTNLWDYDLIILDIEIPGLDGISVCRQLRSQGYTMPILMLTAQNSRASVQYSDGSIFGTFVETSQDVEIVNDSHTSQIK